MGDLLVLLLFALAIIFVIGGVGWAMAVRRRRRRAGRVLWTDSRSGSPTLYSSRYRFYGRPDEVRRLPDGTPFPVELKHRSVPMGGVPRSHRVQVIAYCILLEETYGSSPPYGVLRYGNGEEVRVPFDEASRSEVIELRHWVGQPYDGRATPSMARCRRCPWRPGCDQAAV
ncbi:MAG: PD-(D/E)XK nuclease family protein [Thermoplasmata archaeon]